MSRVSAKQPWRDKIIHHSQIGGIETSVLDNGSAKGVRIAWINTGSGLRFKVVIDRAMDIVDAFYNQHSLTWISHAAMSAARTDVGRNLNWLSTFSGGLLTTCGLSHIGPPESDDYGQRGLHGEISNTPATLESIVQPNPVAGKLDMSITALVKETSVFGPNLELRRTISATLGQPTIHIHDVVANHGNTKAPHMMLYHCNFGWPLVDEATQILWKGTCTSRGLPNDNKLFKSKNDIHRCLKPIEDHNGFGEACGFIDPQADTKGICTAGLYNEKLSLAVALKFKKSQLPCLANWQKWGKGEYVTGIEPGTNPPTGQAHARKEKNLRFIAPGKSRRYELDLSVMTEPAQIRRLIKERT